MNAETRLEDFFFEGRERSTTHQEALVKQRVESSKCGAVEEDSRLLRDLVCFVHDDEIAFLSRRVEVVHGPEVENVEEVFQPVLAYDLGELCRECSWRGDESELLVLVLRVFALREHQACQQVHKSLSLACAEFHHEHGVLTLRDRSADRGSDEHLVVRGDKVAFSSLRSLKHHLAFLCDWRPSP